MAKILKKGDWWVGKKLTCWKCDTEFELEEGDLPRESHHSRPGSTGKGYYTYSVDCPNCKKSNDVYRD